MKNLIALSAVALVIAACDSGPTEVTTNSGNEVVLHDNGAVSNAQDAQNAQEAQEKTGGPCGDGTVLKGNEKCK